MTISLILFGVSFVCGAFLILNKQYEIKNGKALLSLGSAKTDSKIAHMWSFVVYMITHVSVESAKKFTRMAVLKIESLFIQKFDILAKKFSIFGDMVTGHNLPRNRGSVSFFLKNIEVSRVNKK